jgi:endonuclease YncB( thermonuclease family)
MLSFKQEQAAPSEQPVRWKIGIDHRQVALYVGIALMAGFSLGFATARYLVRKDSPVTSVSRGTEPTPRPVAETNGAPSDSRRVTSVPRTDTAEIEGVGTVRMIGIDSFDDKPQYAEHRKDARAFVEGALLGQNVRVEFDEANAGIGNKDENGRVLAYLYARDGALVNGEMIRQGHAFVRSTEQFRMAEQFRSYERDAMQAMRGVWGLSNSSASTSASTPPTTDSTSGAQTEKPKKLSPLLPSEIGPNVPAISGASSASEPVVFVSASDRLYHKSSCEYLSKRKEALAVSEAKSKGYAACGRCFASTVMKAP